MPTETTYSLEELVEEVNEWSVAHHLAPASGQSAERFSLRTLRYYRTMGLLAGPNGGSHYGEFHRLQLSAIRILQAQGLPLRRIQVLLFGRSEGELRQIVEQGLMAVPAAQPMASLPASEDCRMVPLDDTAWLILRQGRQLTADQLAKIHAILHDSPTRAAAGGTTPQEP